MELLKLIFEHVDEIGDYLSGLLHWPASSFGITEIVCYFLQFLQDVTDYRVRIYKKYIYTYMIVECLQKTI